MGWLDSLSGTLTGGGLGMIAGGPVGAMVGMSAGAGYDTTKAQTAAAKDSLEKQIAFILQQSDKATGYLNPYAQGGPNAVSGLQSLAGVRPTKADPPDLVDVLLGAKMMRPEDAVQARKEMKGLSPAEQGDFIKQRMTDLATAQGIKENRVADFASFLDTVVSTVDDAQKKYETYSKEFDSWTEAGEAAKMPIYQPYTPFTESELAKLPATTPEFSQVPAQQLDQFFTDKFGGFDAYIKSLDQVKTAVPGSPEYEKQKGLLQPVEGPNAPDYTQIKQGLYETVAAPESAGKPTYSTLSDAAKPTYGQGQLEGFQDQVNLGRVGTPGQVQPLDLSGNKVSAAGAPNLQQLSANVPTAPGAQSVNLKPLGELAKVQTTDMPQYSALQMTENFDTDNPTYRAMMAASRDELTRKGAAEGKLHSTSHDVAIAKAAQGNAMAILQNQQGRELTEAEFKKTIQDAGFQNFLSSLGFNNTAEQLKQASNQGTTLAQAGFNSDQIQQQFANELGAIQAKQGITGFNNAAVQQQFTNSLNVAAQNLGVSKEQFQQMLSAGDQNATQALAAAGFNNNAALSEWQSKFQTADLNTKVGQANIDNSFRATSKAFQDTVEQAAFNAGVTRNQFLDGLASGNQTFAQQLQAAANNNGVTTQQFNNDVLALGKGFQDSLAKAGFDSTQAMNQFTTAFQNTSANNQVLGQAFGNQLSGAQAQAGITGQQAGLAGQGQGINLQTNQQNAGLAQSDYKSLVDSILANNATGQLGFGNVLSLADKYYNRETGQWDQGLQEYMKQYTSQTGAATQQAGTLSQLAQAGQQAAGQQGSFTMGGTGQAIPALSDIAQANATSAGALGTAIKQPIDTMTNFAMLAGIMGLKGGIPGLQTTAQPF